MGLNTYLRYGAVGRMGLSPQAALAACATQAALFVALAASGAVDRMQAIVPSGIKSAITVAIGIFQAFAGFQLMGLVVKSDETLVELGDVTRPGLWLALTATLFVAAMLVRRTKGALLLGICFTTVASHVLGVYGNASVPVPQIATAPSSQAETPTSWFPSHTLGLDFSAAVEHPQDFGTVVLCMLFIVVFDTAGVQHGLGQQAGLLGDDDRLPGATAAYLASAFSTGLGALLGTSPVIIHNESAAGVQEGGRTGLCAIVTAVLFLFSPMLVPLIELVPPEATAPCLVLVGTMMMGPVGSIDFGDLRVALPAFLIISVTPLAYSISAGVFMGISSYFVLGAVLWVADVATSFGEKLGARLTFGSGVQVPARRVARNIEEGKSNSFAYVED
jgi:AGZA family xanthine/uracil permease-like MFS transporter